MPGWQQKCGFGKVEPPRYSLHFICREIVSTGDDRKWIARKRPGTEYINHVDSKRHNVTLSILNRLGSVSTLQTCETSSLSPAAAKITDRTASIQRRNLA